MAHIRQSSVTGKTKIIWETKITIILRRESKADVNVVYQFKTRGSFISLSLSLSLSLTFFLSLRFALSVIPSLSLNISPTFSLTISLCAQTYVFRSPSPFFLSFSLYNTQWLTYALHLLQWYSSPLYWSQFPSDSVGYSLSWGSNWTDLGSGAEDNWRGQVRCDKCMRMSGIDRYNCKCKKNEWWSKVV